jgi:tetratricopeptide (TPR) repeat protein
VTGPSLVQNILDASFLKGISLWPFVAAAMGNGYFFVIATTILTLVLVGICLLVKYTPNLINDLENGTNSELPNLGLKLWVTLILAFPIFFDAGPLWFVTWWFIVFWGYLNIFEKRIVYVFIALIFMSSWLAHLGAGFLTYADGNVNREIFAIDHAIGSEGDMAALESWIKATPSDAEPLNIKALWELEKGDYETAAALLKRDLDLAPNNGRYYNNLGIVFADLGKNGEAIKSFQNAATLAPGNIIYHFNLSRIYQSTFNFYEADRSIARASKLDPDKVRSLLDQEAKARGGKKYVVEHVPLLDQIGRQMKPGTKLKQAADSLWDSAFGIINRNRSIYMSLALVLILFLLGHIPEDKFTKTCNRCGKHYYAGATSASGYPMCLQCLWIGTKPKKQMNTVLTTKAEDIKGFRVKNARKASRLEFMLPGMGSFYVNKTFKALLRLTIFSGALLLILTGGSFIISFIPADVDYSLGARITGAVVAALLYWRIYKTPPLKYGV